MSQRSIAFQSETGVAQAYQTATVCTPVTVTPCVRAGSAVVVACGTPTVTPGAGAICDGVRNGSCVFTLSQDVCITIPVNFGATAAAGDPFVTCNGVSAEDICTGCGDDDGDEAFPIVTCP